MRVKIEWRSWKGAVLSLVLTAATLILFDLILTKWLDWPG
jgi:hypothetical protein